MFYSSTVFGKIPCKNKLWGTTGLKKRRKISSTIKLARPVTFENGDDKFIYFKIIKEHRDCK